MNKIEQYLIGGHFYVILKKGDMFSVRDRARPIGEYNTIEQCMQKIHIRARARICTEIDSLREQLADLEGAMEILDDKPFNLENFKVPT